jgi:hypothetical protein
MKTSLLHLVSVTRFYIKSVRDGGEVPSLAQARVSEPFPIPNAVEHLFSLGLPECQRWAIHPVPCGFLIQVWHPHPGVAFFLRSHLQEALERKRRSQKRVLTPNLQLVSHQPFVRKFGFQSNLKPPSLWGQKPPCVFRRSESLSHLYFMCRCAPTCTRTLQ